MVLFATVVVPSLIAVVVAGSLFMHWRSRGDRGVGEDVAFLEPEVVRAFFAEEFERTHQDHDEDGVFDSEPASSSDDAAEVETVAMVMAAEEEVSPLGPQPKQEDPTEGWGPDPQGRHEWRYFDETGWSDFVLDGEELASDPLVESV